MLARGDQLDTVRLAGMWRSLFSYRTASAICSIGTVLSHLGYFSTLAPTLGRALEAEAATLKRTVRKPKVAPAPKSSSKIKLDVDDLDEEERQALAEVSKKGYYHGRPKNDNSVVPERVGSGTDVGANGKRAEFDAFQQKWDRFDNEKFVKQL